MDKQERTATENIAFDAYAANGDADGKENSAKPGYLQFDARQNGENGRRYMSESGFEELQSLPAYRNRIANSAASLLRTRNCNAESDTHTGRYGLGTLRKRLLSAEVGGIAGNHSADAAVPDKALPANAQAANHNQPEQYSGHNAGFPKTRPHTEGLRQEKGSSSI